MARPTCSCGQVMYSQSGYHLCLHCEAPPTKSILHCNACRVYHHTVDARVLAEYQAERAEHNQ